MSPGSSKPKVTNEHLLYWVEGKPRKKPQPGVDIIILIRIGTAFISEHYDEKMHSSCKSQHYLIIHSEMRTMSDTIIKIRTQRTNFFRIPTRNTILRWVASFRITGSTLKKKSPGRNSIALRLSEATSESRSFTTIQKNR
ncbi:hypothetical protein ANN_18354 [Periplaneta americana]|uniref:Uncharacterized protein n=1 Tax=Periplaneta americana TaxID=6978 RepID=A0ABQ8SPV3_PERAM|nr:hypothetical protein ANN_18354 [Periplaneta americana]